MKTLVSLRPGVSRPSRSPPFLSARPTRLLISRPSISLARNLVRRRYMQKVHRLVMYFLRYIKPYILWDVRIAAATCRVGRYRLGKLSHGGYAKGTSREDTRITLRTRASD